jgi:hypothetical protein
VTDGICVFETQDPYYFAHTRCTLRSLKGNFTCWGTIFRNTSICYSYCSRIIRKYHKFSYCLLAQLWTCDSTFLHSSQYCSTIDAKCTRILRTSATCFHVACTLQNYSRWTLVAQHKTNRRSAAYQTQRTGGRASPCLAQINATLVQLMLLMLGEPIKYKNRWNICPVLGKVK